MNEEEAIQYLISLGYEKPVRLKEPDYKVLDITKVKCPKCGIQMEERGSIGFRTKGYKYDTRTAFLVCSNRPVKFKDEVMCPSLGKFNTNGCGHSWRVTYSNLLDT